MRTSRTRSMTERRLPALAGQEDKRRLRTVGERHPHVGLQSHVDVRHTYAFTPTVSALRVFPYPFHGVLAISRVAA